MASSLSLQHCTTDFFFWILSFLSSQLSEPVQHSLTNNNSSYCGVPCGTIKIPSESSICLPAMPAVSQPSWATSIPLLQCIIHEPPNSAEDSPGDSQAQQCRTAQGGKCCTWSLGDICRGRGACDTVPRVSQCLSDLRVTLITSLLCWDFPSSAVSQEDTHVFFKCPFSFRLVKDNCGVL